MRIKIFINTSCLYLYSKFRTILLNCNKEYEDKWKLQNGSLFKVFSYSKFPIQKNNKITEKGKYILLHNVEICNLNLKNIFDNHARLFSVK